MKKKIIKKGMIVCLLLMAVLCIPNISKAEDLRLNSLTYQVQLNKDGSANITENWRIFMEDTNTLFKTFEVDKTKYKEITDVKVYEIQKTQKTQFKQINEEKYHVDKDCFYALINKKGQFEIAWGVNQKDTTKTYQIQYKVIDAVKNYQDCSEFYWQFVSNASEIPANNVTGTILLPNPVNNKEELKVWAHGPLKGNIKIVNERAVSFDVSSLKKQTMLETRVVTPNTVFPSNANVSNEAKLDSILTQEQQWADEANRTREQQQEKKVARTQRLKTIGIAIKVAIGLVGIFLIFKIIKYHKLLKEIHKIQPEQELEYYREIPNEKATPAQAAFLYYFNRGSISNNMSNVISATMLELGRKGFLTFDMAKDKKKEIVITIKEGKGQLPQDEQEVLYILKRVPKAENKSFTMKEFTKYIKAHPQQISDATRQISQIALNEHIQKGNYDKELINKHHKWAVKVVLYILIAVVSIFTLPIVIIPAIVATVYSSIITKRYNTLTQKGENEKQKWEALKKYMEEFSMLKDKEVPELVLWEKYLVFATAFGVADKVLKQLKVVYPQLEESNELMINNYAFLYILCHTNMSLDLTKSINSAINVSNYSSGIGAGGGFSGGGGFGGGGGRNGRKIK